MYAHDERVISHQQARLAGPLQVYRLLSTLLAIGRMVRWNLDALRAAMPLDLWQLMAPGKEFGDLLSHSSDTSRTTRTQEAAHSSRSSDLDRATRTQDAAHPAHSSGFSRFSGAPDTSHRPPTGLAGAIVLWRTLQGPIAPDIPRAGAGTGAVNAKAETFPATDAPYSTIPQTSPGIRNPQVVGGVTVPGGVSRDTLSAPADASAESDVPAAIAQAPGRTPGQQPGRRGPPAAGTRWPAGQVRGPEAKARLARTLHVQVSQVLASAGPTLGSVRSTPDSAGPVVTTAGSTLVTTGLVAGGAPGGGQAPQQGAGRQGSPIQDLPGPAPRTGTGGQAAGSTRSPEQRGSDYRQAVGPGPASAATVPPVAHGLYRTLSPPQPWPGSQAQAQDTGDGVEPQPSGARIAPLQPSRASAQELQAAGQRVAAAIDHQVRHTLAYLEAGASPLAWGKPGDGASRQADGDRERGHDRARAPLPEPASGMAGIDIPTLHPQRALPGSGVLPGADRQPYSPGARGAGAVAPRPPGAIQGREVEVLAQLVSQVEELQQQIEALAGQTDLDEYGALLSEEGSFLEKGSLQEGGLLPDGGLLPAGGAAQTGEPEEETEPQTTSYRLGKLLADEARRHGIRL